MKEINKMINTILFIFSMDKKAIVTILCFTILFPTFLSAQDKNYKRYNKRSGIIEYKVSGSQNGTEILYFDNFGVREAKYTDLTIDMFGMKQETKQIVFLDGYMQYTVNPDDNTGSKTEDSMLKQMVESSNDQDWGEAGMKMFISMGGVKTGEEKFMGKTCEIWKMESMGTTVWIWNFIPLKTIVDMMGMKISYEAIRFAFDVSIPENKIAVPKNIEFREFDMQNLQDMMKGMQK